MHLFVETVFVIVSDPLVKEMSVRCEMVRVVDFHRVRVLQQVADLPTTARHPHGSIEEENDRIEHLQQQ